MNIPNDCVRYIRLQRSRFLTVTDDEEVKREYAKWIAEDFAGIEPHLPESVGSILDIGCGMAGIQTHIMKRYPDAKLSLVDGNGKIARGGYAHRSEPYNSRALTEQLLLANGITLERWYDVNSKEPLAADLVISLHSWGYHYPLHTYNVSGFCIADLRRRAEDVRGTVIYEGPKYNRCAFTL